MKYKTLVVYLAFAGYGPNNFKNFINKYKKYNSGLKHKLIICFKNFSKEEKIFYKKKLKKIKCLIYFDDKKINDYDIGSWYRIAKKNLKSNIFFFGARDFPIKKNWLKICNKFLTDNTKIIATQCSYASRSSDYFKHYYKNVNKIKSFFLGIYKLIYYPIFPNPHFRTCGFLVQSRFFCKYVNRFLNKNKIKNFNKEKTLQFESGRDSLFNQISRDGYSCGLVNSDKNIFYFKEWKKSQTNFLGLQEKLLISDHRTENYENSKKLRNHFKKIHWGK
jgi:hypothetical protein